MDTQTNYARMLWFSFRDGLECDKNGEFSFNGEVLPYVLGNSVSFDISCESIDVTTYADWAKGQHAYAPGRTLATVTINGNRYDALAYSVNRDDNKCRVVFVPIEGIKPVQIAISL